MAKRFSRLKYALRAIQDPNSTDTANQPPSNSILENYTEFATGSRPVSYPRDETSFQGDEQIVGVTPFALPLAQTSIVKTGMGTRALNFTNGNSLDVPAGIETNQELAVLELRGFVPAKAVVFVEDSTQPTQPETSQITGIKYKKRAGVSYTIPYGKKTGTLLESEVRAAIQTAVGTIARASVSFKSEKI